MLLPLRSRRWLAGAFTTARGGFHRYSVDERWVVRTLKRCFTTTRSCCAITYTASRVLSAKIFWRRHARSWHGRRDDDRPRAGGFYASQDADVGLDDDGDYFTWTLDEARAVLTPAELEIAAKYWILARLATCTTTRQECAAREAIARRAGRAGGRRSEGLRLLLDSARRKLLAARAERPAPFIDRTLYTGWNAMAVTAYLERREFWARDRRASLRCARWTVFSMRLGRRPRTEARDRVPGWRSGRGRSQGTLEDYAFTVHACIDAWLASGEMKHYSAAVKLADGLIARFYDSTQELFTMRQRLRRA